MAYVRATDPILSGWYIFAQEIDGEMKLNLHWIGEKVLTKNQVITLRGVLNRFVEDVSPGGHFYESRELGRGPK